ncbi:TonB-dependent receptor [Scleromatobacter humisilvae]|uniref:TonB-dependent receptor n=1 Tax=Scleromatobacter humisilvae TaxID=2897159 RepID=A0A9X1YQ94_9BURK|nr:TonB-dependent receptor [Scleromatobacter humisilvae]MCK9688852.1 TonB-dependent receptor [Scleromatobacter humisilvae]
MKTAQTAQSTRAMHAPIARPTAIAAATLCAALALHANQAHAQAAAASAPASAPAQTQSQSQAITEVIVTAQKREQALIDVPASVTAISASRLTEGGLDRLEDYVAEVPGMSIIALSRGYTSVVLRGISTGISQATPSTAFYIDEAPVGSITSYATGSTLTPDLDPADLRRIEVLKGPQGTQYGAGAVGGLVRYVTIQPDSHTFGGSISAGANKVTDGGTGSEGRASLNIPLMTDKLALRVSVLDRKDAGYIDNPELGTKDDNKATTRGGRVALGWSISNDWSLNLSALTQHFKSGGIGMEDVKTAAFTPVTGELEHSHVLPENEAITLDVYNGTLKGRAGDFDLVSSTTYQKLAAETNVDLTPTLGALLPIPGIELPERQTISTKRFSQELRARTSLFDDKLEYEAGLFYTHEDSVNRLPPLLPLVAGVPFAGLGGPLFNAMLGTKFDQVSVFGNATWAVTPTVDLMAGLRYASSTQKYHQDYQKSVLVGTPALIDQKADSDKTNYLLSAKWKPAADMSIYGSVATGYRVGGPSALPPGILANGSTTFKPDSVTSYEVGFKSGFGGKLMSLEAAIFDTEWKDVQAQTSTTKDGVTYQYLTNGGNARSKGAEATYLLFPVPDLTLRATGAYTNSRLTEAAPALGGISGDPMPFTAKWTGSLAADYRFALAGHPAWAGGSYNYIGKRISNFSNTTLGKYPLDVPAYHTFDLNAGIEISKVKLSIYGKNLNNAHGINFVNNTAAGTSNATFNAGIIQPRTIGADVSYAF